MGDVSSLSIFIIDDGLRLAPQILIRSRNSMRHDLVTQS